MYEKNIIKACLIAAAMLVSPASYSQSQPLAGAGHAVDVEAAPDKINLNKYDGMTGQDSIKAQIKEVEGALTSLFQDDYAGAVTKFRAAAKNGNPLAMNSLGVMYDQGLGVDQDYAESRIWYQVAIDNGSQDAFYNLGVLYAEGNGGEVDKEYAKELLGKACELGDTEGCEYAESLNE